MKHINNRYKVLKKLGEGGMGAVFKVEDELKPGFPLALKIIKAGGCNNPELYFRLFKNEFEALAALRHAHIAASYDYGRIFGSEDHYFTSEFVKGTDIFKETEGMNDDQILDVVVQLCRALDYVHSRGLVHHDLKGENILLAEPQPRAGDTQDLRALAEALTVGQTSGKQVKIIDFGLVAPENVGEEVLLGTPLFIAPEKIQGDPVDKRGDLYSLGVILYYLFTRHYPFSSPNIPQLLQMHIGEDPPPPGKYRSDLPPGLEQIILRLLAKDPEDRYDRARSIIEALNQGLNRDYPLETAASKKDYVLSAGLAGREREMDLLQEGLGQAFGEEALPGGVRAFLLLGEAGTGKSKLLDELKNAAQVRGVQVLREACPATGARPYQVLVGLLRQLEMVVPEQLSVHQEFAPLVRFLKGESSQPPPAIPQTFARLVREMSREAPLLLALDDGQRADENTAQALFELAKDLYDLGLPGAEPETIKPPRLLLVAALRANEARGQPAGLLIHDDSSRRFFRDVAVRPLKPEHVEGLLRSMFGLESIPSGFVRQLISLTQGIPLFIEETMKSLIDQNQVVPDGKHWRFESGFSLAALPDSMSAVLLGRVARLGAETRELLEIISVFGQPADPEMLIMLTGAEEKTINYRLGQLKSRQIIAAAAGQGFVPFHQRLGEEVVRALDKDRRRLLHRRLARFLEKRLRGRARENAGELARLYLEGGDQEKGVRFGFLAGEELRRSAMNAEAIRLYRLILQVAPADHPPTLLKANSRLCELYEKQGEYEPAVASMEAALDAGGKLLGPGDRAAIVRKIGQLKLQAGDLEGAQRTIQAGLDVLGSGGSESSRGLLLGALAGCALRRGESERARQLAQQGLELVQQAEPTPNRDMELIPLNNVAGLAQAALGRYAEALPFFRGNRILCDKAYFPQGLGTTLTNLATIFYEQGDLVKALQHCQQAADIFAGIGDPRSEGSARRLLGLVHLKRGDHPRAFAEMREALVRAEETGDQGTLGLILAGLAEINFRIGRPAEGLTLLEKAGKKADPRKNPREQLEIILTFGALVTDQNPGQAQAMLTRSTTGLRRLATPLQKGRLTALLCRGAQAEGKEKVATQHFVLARQIFERIGARFELVQLLRSQARFLVQQGRPEAAETPLAEAEKLAPRCGSPALNVELALERAELDLARDDFAAGRDRLLKVYPEAKRLNQIEVLERISSALEWVEARQTGASDELSAPLTREILAAQQPTNVLFSETL